MIWTGEQAPPPIPPPPGFPEIAWRFRAENPQGSGHMVRVLAPAKPVLRFGSRGCGPDTPGLNSYDGEKNMSKGKHISREQIEAILLAKTLGEKSSATAKRLGISYSAVRKIQGREEKDDGGG